MYTIFNKQNFDFTKDFSSYYFLYSKNEQNITNCKLINTLSKIKEDNNASESDTLIMEVPDENVFLNISFYYNMNLLNLPSKYSSNVYQNSNNPYIFSCNNILYEKNEITNKLNVIDGEPFFNEYRKYKQVNALNIFGDKYSDKFIIDNTVFDINLLFLSNKISILKKQKRNNNNYNINYDNLYLFCNKLKKESEIYNKFSFIHEDIDYDNDSYLFKDLLKLKNKKFYTIFYKKITIEDELCYHENDFIRISDFDIDIKKYNNLFDLCQDNKKLNNILEECKINSLNNFKASVNEKYDELINTINLKKNFINEL